MKIGKFATINGLTHDAVRHYMELGLLLPDKKGGQYDFDKRCQSDLEEVLELKAMGFTLAEVQSIRRFLRLTHLTPVEKNSCFMNLFRRKGEALERQIKDLTGVRQRLEEKQDALLRGADHPKQTIGIPLQALPLLVCTKCGGSLELMDGNILRHQIMEGELICTCGAVFLVKEGIFRTSGALHADEGANCQYLAEYMATTSNDYLDKMYRSMDWLQKRIDAATYNGQIILELGSGIGFFLRLIYNELPEDAVYIAVDHDLRRHRYLKAMLEAAAVRRQVLFICADFEELPLRRQSVDILVDISGTSNYSFDHADFLQERMQPYLKPDVRLISSYIVFKNFAADTQIAPASRWLFQEKQLRQAILQQGFELQEEHVSSEIEEGGKYESYFRPGEKVYSYLVLGKKNTAT